MNPSTHTAAPGRSLTRDLDKYLTITLAGERFGLPVVEVREILEYSETTPVPMMPDYVRGAINLRGKGVPVLDLALRFGRPASVVGRRSCIVIVEAPPVAGQSFDVGLLVDAVNEVVDIPSSEIEPAPSLGGQVKTDFLRGMGRSKDRFIVLLNLEQVLTIAAEALQRAI